MVICPHTQKNQFTNIATVLEKAKDFKKKDGHFEVFFLKSRVVSAVPVFDELVEAIPGIVALIHFKVAVKSLIDGFYTGLDGVAEDIQYTFCPDRTEKKETTTSIPLRH